MERQIENLEDDVYSLEENKTTPKEDKIVMVQSYEPKEPLWILDFDGVVSKEGSGVGVWVSNSKTRHTESHSYKLNIQCTNNIAEYEALMLGFQLLKKFGAKIISIRGDSELILKQIKGEYFVKHPRLRAYRNVVLDFLQCFTEYDLLAIPKDQNILLDDLASSATTCKMQFHPNHQYTIEVKCRPVVPNNIRYWQFFGNDEQIEIFLQSKNEFECANIDVNSDDEKENVDKIGLQEINKKQEDLDILQLKDNILPRGVVPLEELFDFNDVAKKPKIEPTRKEVEDCNIGIEKEPKMIKLSKYLPPVQKHKYIELLKEFIDVFAWSYEDLKSYDTSIIQHKIPIKEYKNHFKQKLRINPKLMPLIEKEIKKDV
jgi:ribonuclease HI